MELFRCDITNLRNINEPDFTRVWKKHEGDDRGGGGILHVPSRCYINNSLAPQCFVNLTCSIFTRNPNYSEYSEKTMDNIFLYFLLFLAIYLFTNFFLRKIRNLPPSPFFSFPIIGHLYLFKKPLYRTLTKISNQYGKVLLLQFGSRSVLLVSSPTAVEECLTKNDVIFANRPNLLPGKYIGYNYTSIMWSTYGPHWRNLRKISTLEVLSSHRLQRLSAIRADEVKSLIRQVIKHQVRIKIRRWR